MSKILTMLRARITNDTIRLEQVEREIIGTRAAMNYQKLPLPYRTRAAVKLSDLYAEKYRVETRLLNKKV